jgi:hypothetical protein
MISAIFLCVRRQCNKSTGRRRQSISTSVVSCKRANKLLILRVNFGGALFSPFLVAGTPKRNGQEQQQTCSPQPPPGDLRGQEDRQTLPRAPGLAARAQSCCRAAHGVDEEDARPATATPQIISRPCEKPLVPVSV